MSWMAYKRLLENLLLHLKQAQTDCLKWLKNLGTIWSLLWSFMTRSSVGRTDCLWLSGWSKWHLLSNQNESSHTEQHHHSCANETGKNPWKETSEDNKLIYKMFSKNLTDNMVFLGIEKIYSESTTKDLSDNIKVLGPPSWANTLPLTSFRSPNDFLETSRRILDKETYKN